MNVKSRTIVLKKDSLEHMPKTTHEFKVIKHRIKKGQNFKVDGGSIDTTNFKVDENGYIRPAED